ncbi:MAG: hypothetical protein R8G66_31875 [Cytophagales bacterium]|nr:hypothetical protein [Cytophagales bacterium]
MTVGKTLLAVGILNLIVWALKVNNHFFDYHLADEVGLLISMGIPWLISRKFQGTNRFPFWLTVLSLLLSTLTLHPILSFALQHTDYAWVIPNILFVTTGILLGNTRFEQMKFSPLFLAGGVVWFLPFQFIPDQNLYFDRLVESTATRHGKIHKVQWKGEQWVHYNGRLSAATIDAHLYYEPLVHPAMSLMGINQNVLLIGGDNSLALQEVTKYSPRHIDVIPLDIGFFKKSTDKDVSVISEEPFVWLNQTTQLYDVIIVDMPDPIDITTNQYYTLEFYELCRAHLQDNGLIVTQASSPYFHPNTHYSIKATLEATGLQTVNYHNQVPTIGQWGWIIASKEDRELHQKLENTGTNVTTRWWNREAMQMMLSFGKSGYFDQADPVINTIKTPLFLSKP